MPFKHFLQVTSLEFSKALDFGLQAIFCFYKIKAGGKFFRGLRYILHYRGKTYSPGSNRAKS